jgi:preprotein translocase subunit SecE
MTAIMVIIMTLVLAIFFTGTDAFFKVIVTFLLSFASKQ